MALERKPLRSFLHEREPLIPHKKLVDIFGIDPDYLALADYFTDFLYEQAPPVIAGLTPAQMLEVMAQSKWAQSLAAGVCGLGYVGLTPGTLEYDRCVFNVSHKVAAKQYGIPWVPTPAPPARRRRGE